MQTRRQFVTRSTAALAATRFLSAAAQAAPMSAFGVQLYTARKEVMADPKKVLEQIRRIGYRCVETFAAEYTLPARELRSLITDAGFELPSAHYTYEDFGKRFEYARELGARFVVVGSTPVSVGDSADGFKRAAQQYNQWGEQARKLGLEFAFHNHNSEFQSFDGQTGLDILLKETDPHLVKWQMDCYWVTQGGFDPLRMIRLHGDRLQTLHFKDRKPGFAPSTILGKDAQHFTEIGTGTIDYRAIWQAASAAGVKYFFVEQDTTEIPALESLAVSYKNLVRLLG